MSLGLAAGAGGAVRGPLAVCASNPRVFADAAGRAVYLTGSHHWDNLVDNEARPPFDFDAYLDRLTGWGHSLIRLWAQWAWTRPVHPSPYLRLGDGRARDGLPRFDLERFDPAYFARLRRRVARAGERGLYVSVMLFQGWSLRDYGEGDPWPHHPYHRDNNVNGVDGDPRRRGDGTWVHTLRVPAITRLQERYVERAVEAVGDLPGVLWEIANESHRGSHPWQLHMLAHLRSCERARGRRRPAGLTSPYGGGANRALLASPADWISPDHRGGYRRAPPSAEGAKVMLLDSDHLWGIGGDPGWVWKAFTRGYHPLYMDPLDADPAHQAARRAMGATRRLAGRLDLGAARPAPRRAAGGFCLAAVGAGRESLVVYLPRGRGWVDLSGVTGRLGLSWIDPVNGSVSAGRPLAGGGRRRLAAPCAGAAVAFLDRGAGRSAPAAG